MTPAEIPGWTCPAIERLYSRPWTGTLVEIGVAYGRSIAVLAQHADQSARIYGVDPWVDFMGGDNLPPEVFESLRAHGSPQQACVANLTRCGLRDRVELVLGTSAWASTLFDDASCDLVFIDGDHRYESVREDIRAWRPKVRPGGLLAGHDYTLQNFPGVVRAVEEEFGNMGREIDGVVWSVRL